jgi:hypothetical protein
MLNTRTLLILILPALLLTGFNKPEAERLYFQQTDCSALTDIHIINFEAAGTSFEEFQAEGEIILFFGDIDANLDTIRSQANGKQLYCDYLESRRPIFPADSSIYTYPYLGPDYTIVPTETGADIVASPEKTPEPGRDGNRIPDRWWAMMQLITLMTGGDQTESESSSEQEYTIDELMAESRALAKAYIYAQLWDADTQAWKADPTEGLQIKMVAESFGTAFARTFLVALAERMAEIGYNEADIEGALASVRFLAIADVVPPFEQEAGSLWTRLESIPTLSVIHANEDFARYYGALPYYEHYIPLDSHGNLTEGVWSLAGERYIYVKVALDQENVHGVTSADLARDPLWLDIWDRLRGGSTLIEALGSVTEN